MASGRPQQRSLQDAIRGGLEYLASRRSAGAFWKDFELFGGESDMWVTGFVGSMLAELGDDQAHAMAAGAMDWLVSRPPHERWAYSAAAARDADSTTWVLRLAERLGRNDVEVGAAYAFLDGHVDRNGAVCTFQESDYRARYGDDSVDRSGWYSGHGCVSAAAAGLTRLTGVSRLLRFLREAQRPDGSWVGYWWLDREYTSALAVEALSATRDVRDAGRAQHAARWVTQRFSDGAAVRTRQCPEGSPFVTAFAMRLLLFAGTDERIRWSALEWLLRSQQANGSWRASAVLRVPFTHEIVPDESRWSHHQPQRSVWDSPWPDQNRCLTTAAVINALHLVAPADPA